MKQLLEKEQNDKKQKIQDLEEINNNILTNFDKNINEIKTKKSYIKKDEDIYNNTFIINENKNFLEPKLEKFYDVIIDIKSIKDINIGWEIKMNKRGEKKYNKFKNEKALIIGIIGNSNRGKSFLLSKISKINLPVGTSIRTEGLIIKYPELEKYKNRNIILLDSAGIETPLLLDKDNTII